jgi:hypothetical protein
VLVYSSQVLGQHRASYENTDPAKSNQFHIEYKGQKDSNTSRSAIHFPTNLWPMNESCNIPCYLKDD